MARWRSRRESLMWSERSKSCERFDIAVREDLGPWDCEDRCDSVLLAHVSSRLLSLPAEGYRGCSEDLDRIHRPSCNARLNLADLKASSQFVWNTQLEASVDSNDEAGALAGDLKSLSTPPHLRPFQCRDYDMPNIPRTVPPGSN